MVHRLYDKIGGRTTITNLVRIFYEKAQADQTLGQFFQNADMEGLRARQAMFLTMLLGGEQKFTGRDLGAAHADARKKGMDDATFDTLLRLFRESLDQMQVDGEYTEEIIERLESTRSAVLGRG